MELYKTYRPKDFDQIIGQDIAVKTLESAIENDNVPHFIMFTGPRGCGKTTIARIMRRKLRCSKHDFIEDAPRKIEDVRRIKTRIHLSPMRGKCRIWLIDECFISRTIIKTPNGFKFIKDLKPGDSVFSVIGKDKVLNIFTKEIPLNRLTKVIASDSRALYCSDSHEFYTKRGWVEAKNLLKKDLIFSFVCHIMQERLLNQGDKHESQSMSRVRRGHAKIYKGKKNTNILQQKMCYCPSLSKIYKTLSRVWKTNNSISKTSIQQDILQQEMFINKQERILSRKTSQYQNKAKNKTKTDKVFPDKKRKERSKKKFSKNVKEQSNAQFQNCRKNESNENKKRNPSSVERKEGWKWSIYKTAKKIMGIIRERLANRISYINQTKIPLSLQLQGRYRKQKIKNRNRDRWKGLSYEESYAKRCEKTKPSAIIRVENIEIYKQGSNDQSFENVVGDRELRGNCITLYDIEVEKHPSYFANGILVHNCHKLTSDAQDEFLKMLEDTPRHVYFLFTTTDPQKLKSTIKDRCTEITVKPLNTKNLNKLIDYVCKEERLKVPSEVCNKIVENSDSSARKALVHLDSIANLKTKSEQLNAIVTATAETQAFAIIRALLYKKNTSWKEMARILKETEDEEPEQMRWLVLACCKTEMLKAGKFAGRAYIVIDAFRDNFYDSKKAGLVAACYEVIEGGKE